MAYLYAAFNFDEWSLVLDYTNTMLYFGFIAVANTCKTILYLFHILQSIVDA